MLTVVVLNLNVGDGSIEELVENLAFVGVDEEAVLVFAQLTLEIVLDVPACLFEDDGLTYPLVNISIDNGEAVLGAEAGGHEALKVAGVELLVVDAGDHGLLDGRLTGACRQEHQECQEANSESDGLHRG